MLKERQSSRQRSVRLLYFLDPLQIFELFPSAKSPTLWIPTCTSLIEGSNATAEHIRTCPVNEVFSLEKMATGSKMNHESKMSHDSKMSH